MSLPVYNLLVGAGVLVVLVALAWFVMSEGFRGGGGGRGWRGGGRGVGLRTGRGWGRGNRWRPRYFGAVGYPIVGYPTWYGGTTPCILKCADQLADCKAVSPGDPLCDLMYRGCAADC